MQHLGLNSNIKVGSHKFHVQTAYSASYEKILSHIFNNGQIIEQRIVPLEEDSDSEAITLQLKAVHQDMVSEMELLFYIAEKVKQVKHATSCSRLGQVFLEKNLLDDAQALFETSLELAPNSPDVYQYLGITHFRKGELQTASSVLQKGLRLAPSYADSHYYFGLVLLEKGELGEALSSFETALKINPQFVQAQLCLALANLLAISSKTDEKEGSSESGAQDRIKLASETIEQIHDSGSKYKNHPRLKTALKLIRQEAFPAAATELQSLRKETQAELGFGFENEFYLKFLYGGKSRDDDFVLSYTEKLRSSLREHPDYADLHNNLGVAYLIQCRNLFLKALEEFRTALKINPKFKRAEKNLKLSENDGKGFLILLRAILK